MRSARWTVLAVAALVVLSFATPVSGSGPPPDVASHWARAEIGSLRRIGAVGGFPDGSFRPDDTITWAQFVRLLTAALRMECPDGPAPFPAVEGHWAEAAFSAAVRAGILRLEDHPAGFFPDAPLSRLDMASMLVRAGGLSEDAPAGFSDVGHLGEEQLGQIRGAANAGLVTGFPDGSFRPEGAATRAEAAVMVVRLLNLLGSISPAAADFAHAAIGFANCETAGYCALISESGHAIVTATDPTLQPSIALAFDGRLVSASGVLEHPAYIDGRLTHVPAPTAINAFVGGMYLTSWALECDDDGKHRDHLPPYARTIDRIAAQTPGMVIESVGWRGLELPGGHEILWSRTESAILIVVTEYGGMIDGLAYPLIEPGRFTRVPAGEAAFGRVWNHDVYVLPFSP